LSIILFNVSQKFTAACSIAPGNPDINYVASEIGSGTSSVGAGLLVVISCEGVLAKGLVEGSSPEGEIVFLDLNDIGSK
jgi:hypothetical protein